LCRHVPPVLTEQAPGHFAACHYAGRLRLAGAFDQAASTRGPAAAQPLAPAIEGGNLAS
jgi:hypothetical protein